MEGEVSDSSRLNLTYLKAAFMAMEPADCLITLARKCGGGYLTEEVQSFISEHCIRDAIELDITYVKGILKKVIICAESSNEVVYEGLYEQIANYMSSFKEHETSKSRVLKHVSFLFDEDANQSPKSFSVPLHCSVNMLEGDTGCTVWPASLFLSEYILSYPNIFCNKYCFEVGSGVGLVGVVLTKVKASEVILSDGDLSSLANLKLNLELNQLCTETAFPQKAQPNLTSVKCKHLPWEIASETELKHCQPDIILGADVIYNPSCVPHLVRLLSLFLLRKTSHLSKRKSTDLNGFEFNGVHKNTSSPSNEGNKSPTAYIATVVRNVETFNYFLKVAREAHLTVVDITETNKPLNLMPYMLSYDQVNIRLYKLFFLGN